MVANDAACIGRNAPALAAIPVGQELAGRNHDIGSFNLNFLKLGFDPLPGAAQGATSPKGVIHRPAMKPSDDLPAYRRPDCKEAGQAVPLLSYHYIHRHGFELTSNTALALEPPWVEWVLFNVQGYEVNSGFAIPANHGPVRTTFSSAEEYRAFTHLSRNVTSKACCRGRDSPGSGKIGELSRQQTHAHYEPRFVDKSGLKWPSGP